MSSCRLLYLDAHKLSAYYWRQGNLRQEGCFEASSDGIAQFSTYLEQHGRDLFHLLANIGDEGYQSEDIPFLRGRDRQALLQRKLAQYFFATPLTASISLGFGRDTRKNEKVLLTALTNPAAFEPWLAALERTGIALSGIYSLAQLGGALLTGLGIQASRCLLLSIQDKSLRESFIVDGQTVFSRLTPLVDSSCAGIATAFANEAPKLQQYLLTQRLIGRDEAIPTLLLTPSAAQTAVRCACEDHSGLKFRCIDSREAAVKLGLRLAENSNDETLFLHLLARATPRTQYAPPRQRHRYRIVQLRRLLWTSGAVALAGAVIFAGERMLQTARLDRETTLLRQQEQVLQQRYRQLSASFPPLPVDKDSLRRIIARHDELLASNLWPAPALRRVASVLDQTPSINLETLEWKAIGNDKGSGEMLILGGNILSGKFAGARQTLAAFDSFVAALEQLPRTSASVLQQPFEIESSKALRSGERDGDVLPQRPFSVQIVVNSQP